MKKTSKQLDQYKIHGVVRNTDARRMIEDQNGLLSSMLRKNENTMIKIEYFDTVLNFERKMEHFVKIFGKIRLRVIHKPFIILDMLKIMSNNRSSVKMFVSLMKKILKTRQRDAVDSMIKYVEHKTDIWNNWGEISRKLLHTERIRIWKKIEADTILEHKKTRQVQRMRRGLKFFGTIVNSMIRDNKRDTWSYIQRRSFERSAMVIRKKKKEQEMEIAGNQGFIREKVDRVGPSDDTWTEGESKKKKEDEKDEDSSFNHYKIGNNQMNAYFHKKGDSKQVVYGSGSDKLNVMKKKGEFESSFEEVEETTVTQKVQAAMVKGDSDPDKILTAIKAEIERVKSKLDDDNNMEDMLSMQEKIDRNLSQLTNLMQMLKEYYQTTVDDSNGNPQSKHKKNFEGVLKLLQKLINQLLLKMSSGMEIATMNVKSGQGLNLNEDTVSFEEEKKKMDSNIKSIYQIDELNKNLTKEIENLNKFEESQRRMPSDVKPFTKPFESYKVDNFESNDAEESLQEFQSVGGIDRLFQEMTQNLKNMNSNHNNESKEDNLNEIDIKMNSNCKCRL